MSATDLADAAVDLACETLYRFLAAALNDPRSDELRLVLDHAGQELAVKSADLLRSEFAEQPIPLGFGELPVEELDLRPAVAELNRPVERLCDEFIRVFGLVTCHECPPYETEYHRAEETFFRSQQMADVGGFYRAFGLQPSDVSHERPDHLVLELEFEALMLTKKRLALTEAAQNPQAIQQATVCQEARASFFRDHLSWWIPSFAVGLRRKAQHGFYAEVGRALAALLPVERQRLCVPPPLMPLQASFIESPNQCDGCLVDLKP